MKICHIATGFPITHQGGITNYVRSIAEAQLEKNNEVVVLTAPCQEKTMFRIEEYSSDKIIPFKIKERRDIDGLKRIDDFLKKEKFDIIHIHMAMDIDMEVYKILKEYKYIVSLHDYFFLCPRIQMIDKNKRMCSKYEEKRCKKCISVFNLIRFFNGIEYRIQNRLGYSNFSFPAISNGYPIRRLNAYKQLLENAQMLLPVSNKVEEIFRNSGIQAKYKVVHIGNITADTFSNNFKYNINQDKIKIVMLGNLSYIKGADLFIKIAERLDKTKFEIHFFGRSDIYKDKIKNAGIISHGSYSQNNLKTILEDIDLGFVLSVWEDNGPQVVMEMLNNHVPVIGTRLGGIPDFVNDSNGYLFNPYDEDEINSMIMWLNKLSKSDILKLKRNIKRTTTIAEHFEMLEKIYNDIVGGRVNEK